MSIGEPAVPTNPHRKGGGATRVEPQSAREVRAVIRQGETRPRKLTHREKRIAARNREAYYRTERTSSVEDFNAMAATHRPYGEEDAA